MEVTKASILLSMLLNLLLIPSTYGHDERESRRIILKEGDPRMVTCRDLVISDSSLYRSPGVEDYAVLLVREEAKQVIVGARNHLLRLNLSNLEELEKVEAFPDDVTSATCLAKGQNKDDCHNFFRVVVRDGQKVLTCGTNSFSPQCQWRRVDSLSHVISTMSGVGKCPFSPLQNSTFIVTSDQNFYSATVTDFAARDAAIYRMMGSSRHLRTIQYNSRWLNEPDFVSSYEIGPYVYFLFRETAIEFINCGKVIYSRVARICQNDQGGNVLLQDNWTTFSKARLNCSIPGAYPFHFNELQNTLLDIENELIYAIFTTSPTGILGSAVCLYNLSSLEFAFHGPFKYQQDSNSAWSRYPNKLPHYQCGHNLSRHHSTSTSSETTHGTHVLLETSKYQLMDRAVQPRDIFPAVVVEDQRYTHIAKDEVWLSRQNTSVVVLFLASLSGYIDKMALLPVGKKDGTSSCLVERIRIACGTDQRITSLELIKWERHLIVGTNGGLHKIPVQRCRKFTTKIQCHNSQDPYCGWDETQNSCLAIGHQHFYSCPIVNASGAKEERRSSCHWSPWQACHHVIQSNSTGVRSTGDKRCLCRTRDCSCPDSNRGGGRGCEGHQVEITNCSYPTSKRHPSSSNHWLPWSEWTSCSGKCFKGHQTRSRLCYSSRGGCYGNSIDIRECRIGSCEVSDSKTDWTAWHISRESKMSRVEERHRCSCKTDPSTMSISPTFETVMRTCSTNQQTCTNETFLAGSSLLTWSDWSQCSVTCGFGGTQRRHKLCLFGNSSCTTDGHQQQQQYYHHHHHNTLQEIRSCSSPLPCQTSFWSCWSSLSPCSVTCGRGSKFRTRVCLDWLKTDDPSYSKEAEFSEWCSGASRQEIVCEAPSCDHTFISINDFLDSNNDDGYLESSGNFTQSESGIQSYHLIIVGIICFFLGGIVIVIVLSHCKLSFLFGKERLPPSFDGSEKCNAVAAFSPDGVRTVATKHPYFATNGVAPVADSISQREGSNATNSSKTPLISAKRLASACPKR